MLETFISIGIDELSVSPRSVLPLRAAVRELDTTTFAERIRNAIDSDESTKF